MRKRMKEKKYMNLPGNYRVIISGGGTGGHIFPAISVANALRKIDPLIEILFVGAEGRIEMDKVPAAGYKIIGLPVAGFLRKITFRNFIVLFKLFESLAKAKKIIKEFNPGVIVGVGGYASGPVLRQAGNMNIPTLIQEQNSYAGITNRLLAKKASVICIAYDGMEKYFPPDKIIKTGNPVRNGFENLITLREEAFKYFNLDRNKPVILVLGGSGGAGVINNCLKDHVNEIAETGYQWVWQSGKNYYEKTAAIINSSKSSDIRVYNFIDRMDYAYSAADIIVSRAGAGTISELCIAGKPVILIPSPNVAENHQYKNAMALVNKNAALLVPDAKVSDDLVKEVISLYGDEKKKKMLSENILKLAISNADDLIAREIIKLLKK
jgi:UDP-N-acetylglucosamine--N-acetylmuramyl-(pentapeptide) pyrophosphoryl-undecaprenol N-acetylglucosamine transferase